MRIFIAIRIFIILFIASLVALTVYAVSKSRPEAHIYESFRLDHCQICDCTNTPTNRLELAHCYPYNMAKGTDLEYLITTRTNCYTACHHDHLKYLHHGNFSKYWDTHTAWLIEQLHFAHIGARKDLTQADIDSGKAEYEKQATEIEHE